jgi:hypothetical protein
MENRRIRYEKCKRRPAHTSSAWNTQPPSTSQKDCVSYVTNGGTLTTTPPPVRFGSLIDCELLGGIYTTYGDYPLWRCLGMYFPDQAHSVAGNATLAADCVAEGGGAYTSLGTIPGTTDAWCHAP